MQDSVIELARDLQRPERRALLRHRANTGRSLRFWRFYRDRRDALGAIDLDRDKPIVHVVGLKPPLEPTQRNSLAHALTLRCPSKFLRTRCDFRFEPGIRQGF